MSSDSIYSILEHIRQGKCSLFIGSALSTICGMPSSQKLAKEIASHLKSNFPNVDIKTIEEIEGDLGKVSQLYQKISKDDFAPHLFIQDRLLEAEQRADTTLYENLAKIAFPYIITTNYDRLIERTRKPEIRPRNILRDDANAADITLGKETILVKMHGDLEEYQSMVLTEGDLQDFRKKNKTMGNLILQILKQGPILFLGFSKSSASFIDIAVDYINELPENRSPHAWYIVDHSSEKHMIASLNNENAVFIKDDLRNFIQYLCDAFSSPSFVQLPSDISLGEILNRLAFQVKEIDELLLKIKSITKELDSPHQQLVKEINQMNELEALQTEVDILRMTVDVVEEYEKDQKDITEETIINALGEAKEMYEPVKSKTTREAQNRIEEVVVGKSEEIGHMIDDDVFKTRCRKYLKLFMPKYGDASYTPEDILQQEDHYAEILSLWKNNRQAEFFAEYYLKKYMALGDVWPPKVASFPRIEDIQLFVPVENFQEIYSDSVFLQSVKTGLQRLNGGLEDTIKYYVDNGLLGSESERPATMERILTQNIKELRSQIKKLQSEIDKKKTKFM